MGWLSYHSTHGGEELLRSCAATCEMANAVNLASATPTVASWLCTFDGPIQRLGIVSAALWGTSSNAVMKRRPAQGAPGGAECAGLRIEVGSVPKSRPVLFSPVTARLSFFPKRATSWLGGGAMPFDFLPREVGPCCGDNQRALV